MFEVVSGRDGDFKEPLSEMSVFKRRRSRRITELRSILNNEISYFDVWKCLFMNNKVGFENWKLGF